MQWTIVSEGDLWAVYLNGQRLAAFKTISEANDYLDHVENYS